MRTRSLVLLAALLAPVLHAQEVLPIPAYSATNLPSVFWYPHLQERYAPLALRVQQLFNLQNYTAAEALCTQAVAIVPWDAGAVYNLACAQARTGKPEAALETLARAVELGFRNPDHLRRDPDLASIRSNARFATLVAEARDTNLPPYLVRRVTPLPVENSVAWVRETNTAWDARTGAFAVFLVPETNRAADIVVGHGKAGDLLRQWYKEGTAAGNVGDFYDNRDGDHSNLACDQFPQLARLEYSPEAQVARAHYGHQASLFFNHVTFGNSSTANTAGPFWRGQARFMYADPRKALLLYLQYVGNHLYMYPEHRDHDPGVDGEGGGYGDVSPVNTPYLIISQGSSGSDQPFMNAVALTLAAFRPDVKALLTRSGALMPTVQMIFRQSNRNLESPEDYLTGKAHPTVFEGANVDPEKMVALAHDLASNSVPPVIQLQVEEEDRAVVGRDYFDAAEREKLFDTPCAIARVARSMQHTRRMVVSAKASRDLNGRPLQFTWRVLRGDADRITIKPLGKNGASAELLIPYHERGPIAPGSALQSSRVDIGVFAHNGVHYSAPGFVTVYYLANEKREYDAQRRIRVCDYADAAYRNRYVDPLLDLPKDWRDEYAYDDQGRLAGWTRVRGDEKQVFTADGALALETDSLGRPTKARSVVYMAKGLGRDRAPTLEQRPGTEVVTLKYASDKDRIGRTKSREFIAPSAEAAETPEPLE
jgi:tetratricopeptide (TPR) repeat protein